MNRLIFAPRIWPTAIFCGQILGSTPWPCWPFSIIRGFQRGPAAPTARRLQWPTAIVSPCLAHLNLIFIPDGPTNGRRSIFTRVLCATRTFIARIRALIAHVTSMNGGKVRFAHLTTSFFSSRSVGFAHTYIGPRSIKASFSFAEARFNAYIKRRFA